MSSAYIANGTLAVALQKAAQQQTLLRFNYIDDKNVTTIRNVEPYEVKEGKLYAHCLDRGAIRAFKLDHIGQPTVTNTAFEPRFPIKIN